MHKHLFILFIYTIYLYYLFILFIYTILYYTIKGIPDTYPLLFVSLERAFQIHTPPKAKLFNPQEALSREHEDLCWSYVTLSI